MPKVSHCLKVRCNTVGTHAHTVSGLRCVGWQASARSLWCAPAGSRSSSTAAPRRPARDRCTRRSQRSGRRRSGRQRAAATVLQHPRLRRTWTRSTRWRRVLLQANRYTRCIHQIHAQPQPRSQGRYRNELAACTTQPARCVRCRCAHKVTCNGGSARRGWIVQWRSMGSGRCLDSSCRARRTSGSSSSLVTAAALTGN